MKLNGLISAVIAVSVMAGALVIPTSADELFIGVYTEEDFIIGEENDVRLEAEVPDGDYEVEIKTGGETKTEASIYINGGERVAKYTLKEGQMCESNQPAVPKDGKIDIQVLGKNPNVTEISVKQIEKRGRGEIPTIYIAGDSTSQVYNYETDYPMTGWGQLLYEFFGDGINIENRSMGGRSIKSYNNDGRLDAILTQMHEGDYVFIQFGINDAVEDDPVRYTSVEEYEKLLREKYVGEIRKRGGVPVLLTPSAAGWWDEENNCFKESRQEYAEPTRRIAAELGCSLIDINKMMTDTWNEMGKDALSCYFICEPLESGIYPEGEEDFNHMKAKGAEITARLIANAVGENVPELSKYLKGGEVFSDISGHWAEDAINALAEQNILHGVGDGKFDPDGNVTRAELLKMIMDTVEIPGHAYREGECFEVKQSDWYCYFVQGAADKGLIPPYMLGKGTTLYKTNKEISKTASTEIYRYSALSATGAKQTFNGDKPITREEMAALIMSCMDYKMKDSADWKQMAQDYDTGFADEKDIDAHYINAVQAAHFHEYISGMENNKFEPKSMLTRAQAAMIISRLAGEQNE